MATRTKPNERNGKPKKKFDNGLFCELFQREEVLYNTLHPDYRDRDERDAACNRILSGIGNDWSGKL